MLSEESFSAERGRRSGIGTSFSPASSTGTLTNRGWTAGSRRSIGSDNNLDIHTARASARESVLKHGNFIKPKQKSGRSFNDSGKMSCPDDEDDAHCKSTSIINQSLDEANYGNVQ
jgi:hypothetical protein